MTYPNMLAGGVTSEGTWLPTELFAGESPVTTDHGIVGASAITILQIVARGSDGKIIPWDETAGVANKAGTFSGVGNAADTITVNGVVFTLSASPVASTDVLIGGTATATALNFANAVNANTETTHIRAVPAAAVVTLYALEPGTAGNSLAISEASSSFSFAGGATALSGGVSEEESRAIGIAAQPGAVGGHVPYFTGGVFNANALTWPASVSTLAARKAVFDRTKIGIDVPLGVQTPFTYPA
jgi:hypothetical protein